MNAIRRGFGIGAGLALGGAAALVFLPIGLLFNPLTREAGLDATLLGALRVLSDAIEGLAPEETFQAIAAFAWTIVMAVCVAPVVMTALIGEAAGMRSLVYYSGGTGFLAGAAPWILRAAQHSARATEMTRAEAQFAILFFLTGALAGAVYWLVAVRRPEIKG
jgi:hypothetical protein